MRVRFVTFMLILTLVIPQLVAGQQTPVTPSELQKAIADAAKTRQKNLADVRGFFARDHVKDALKSGKIDYQRVDKAVATLSADELARLADRTRRIDSDFAAGALNNQELTYIIIALAAAVIVLIAVH